MYLRLQKCLVPLIPLSRSCKHITRRMRPHKTKTEVFTLLRKTGEPRCSRLISLDAIAWTYGVSWSQTGA
jgi:hypothetical protein